MEMGHEAVAFVGASGWKGLGLGNAITMCAFLFFGCLNVCIFMRRFTALTVYSAACASWFSPVRVRSCCCSRGVGRTRSGK